MSRDFVLPPAIATLVAARNAVRDHYNAIVKNAGGQAHLSFTFDGNLVGDIGEALAVELFGIRLDERKSFMGIDGYTPDGKTVQVKATTTKRGPAFRNLETRAEHLLFFDLDLDAGVGTVVFNGPEHHATAYLPEVFEGQRMLTPKQIRAADDRVADADRLQMDLQPLPDAGRSFK